MHLIEEEFLFEGGKAGMSRKRLYLRGGGGGGGGVTYWMIYGLFCL